MNVAALQKHLRDLADFLAAAEGGKAVVAQLNAIHDALAPFKDAKLAAFAAFLQQAHEYQTTGVFTPKKGTAAKPAAATPTLVDVKAKLATLYEQAAAASDAQIDELLGPLAENFQLTDLKVIATAAQVEGKVAKVRAKGKVVDEIRKAITDRRAIAQRSVQ